MPWVLIGWQFTLGEYLGGIVMIVLMALLLRVFVSPCAGGSGRAPGAARQTAATSTTHGEHGRRLAGSD